MQLWFDLAPKLKPAIIARWNGRGEEIYERMGDIFIARNKHDRTSRRYVRLIMMEALRDLAFMWRQESLEAMIEMGQEPMSPVKKETNPKLVLAMKMATPKIRKAIEMILDGWTQCEAARHIGLSPAGLHGELSRLGCKIKGHGK